MKTVNMDKRDIEDVLALTPMQGGMLFLYLKDPQNDYYFEQLALEISGSIDTEMFKKAWNFVIENNEMLRTSFRWEKLNKPAQVIIKNHSLHLTYHDLSVLSDSTEKQHMVEKIKQDDRNKKFDLREVPMRFILCKMLDDHYYLIISNHHILLDGWSTGIVLKEFIQTYVALHKGFPRLERGEKPLFKEYIKWEQKRNRDEEKEFWKSYLQGLDVQARFPVQTNQYGSGSGVPGPGGEGDVYGFSLEQDLKDKLEIFLKQSRITMATFFYSVWGILLRTYCSSDDVVFGTTVSGRSVPFKGIEEMVGLFINTVPLRIQTHAREKITDMLSRLNQALQRRENYENSAITDIKEYIGAAVHEELFDTAVVMENYPLDDLLNQDNGAFSFASYSIFEMTHYTCTVCITLRNKIDIRFCYHKSRLSGELIMRLARHFASIMERIIHEPGKSVFHLDITSAAEKKQILIEFNRTDAPYPRDKGIHHVFVEQVKKRPDHTALVSRGQGAEPQRSNIQLTYKELDNISHQLALLLREKGIAFDVIAGVLVERSLDMIISLLAILKAGGAYLPIDPDYPPERINTLLRDSHSRMLLTYTNFEKQIGDDYEVLWLPEFFSHQRQLSQSIWKEEGDWLHRLAYVIYTSGSTGIPKGVAVEHGSVVNLLEGLNILYPFTGMDVYLLKTSYLFDVSVTELFGWFWGGGKLALLETGGDKTLYEIIEAIEYVGVTHINFVPSQFNVFVDLLTSRNIKRISALKYIFLAGEALLPELVNKFRSFDSAIRLENLYGPTEAAVYASVYSLSHWQGDGAVPIGKPFSNTKIYILNRDNGLQPIGIPGELCIAGIGLARGYLNRGGLTLERFVNHKSQITNKEAGTIHNKTFLRGSRGQFLQKAPPGRRRQTIYKTGDLACWLLGGDIEFLGRIDQQVKIRGFRIELGEIENRLFNHPAVKEAVVTAKADKSGDHFLCAYVVPYSQAAVNILLLRHYLQQKLPYYMVPAYFVILETLPLTSSGKILRQALPHPDLSAAGDYNPPRNDREEALVDIWADVLGVAKEKIGIDTNFFALGGHSLKAIIMISLIQKKFNIRIPLSRIFDNSTIRGLAECLKEPGPGRFSIIKPAEKKEYYAISSSQKRFYILQQTNPTDLSSHIPAVWELRGKVEIRQFAELFRGLSKRHESLRTAFVMIENEVAQKISPEISMEIEYYQSAYIDAGGIVTSFIRPFDLSQAPLFRVGMVKTGEEHYLLMIDMHHIITDAFSIEILVKELMVLYKNDDDLDEIRVQYKDFSEWHRTLMESGEMRKQEEYWLNLLQVDLPALEMPTDHTVHEPGSFTGGSCYLRLDDRLISEIEVFVAEVRVTKNILLLAVYYVLLSKYSGQEDIIVGSAVAGRTHADLKKIIGLFFNLVALRSYPQENKTFSTFLEEVKTTAVAALDNQDFPFNELVWKLGIEPQPGKYPVFDTLFTMQNIEIAELQFPGLHVEAFDFEFPAAKFNLYLDVIERHNTLGLLMKYSTLLYDASTVKTILEHYIEILRQVIKDRNIKLKDIAVSDDFIEIRTPLLEGESDDFGI